MEKDHWWKWYIAWDGFLPLAISLLPVAVKMFLPRSDILEISVAILVPLFAALLRCGIGSMQIRGIFDGALPPLRQVALAAAIVLLICYEALVAMFVFADDNPQNAWLVPVVFYLFYLATIAFAFAPRMSNRPT